MVYIGFLYGIKICIESDTLGSLYVLWEISL